MTDAPEKIWHTIDRQGKISSSPDAHVEPCLEVSSSYIEYTRTDISQARYNKLERQAVNLTETQMQWEARIVELEAALTSLLELNDNHSPFGGEMYWDRVERIWDTARAALKSKP